jgi:L-fuculose-phosphate aldolase
MLRIKLKEEVVRWAKELTLRNLTVGTGGNVSCLEQSTGYMLITPSGMEYLALQTEDLVVMDLNGRVVEGRWKPSSEWRMHAEVYKQRPEIQAVVHAHSTYATAVSCLQQELPAIHYMVALAGKSVPCAPYATFGSEELAERACETMAEGRAVLLANHGIVTAAESLSTAFRILEEIEQVARLYCITKSMGNPVVLPEEEMQKMQQLFRSYGQK